MEAINWGDFLFGSVAGMIFMVYTLKHVLLPRAIDSFIIDGVGKTYTEECEGKLYDIKISRHGRGDDEG